MPTPAETEDLRLFYVEDAAILHEKGFDLPHAIACRSFAAALDMVSAASMEDRRPWIQVDGVLFRPAQIAVPNRHVGRRREPLRLDPPEASSTIETP